MEFKLMDKPEFRVVGIRLETTRAENEANEPIGRLWHEFMARIDEIPNRVDLRATYGISLPPAQPAPDAFAYVAGAEASDPDPLPSGMTAVTVPAHRYAVFTFKGKFVPSRFRDFMRAAYERHLPEVGLRPADCICFEYYDERFNDSDDCEMDLYIPVR